MAMADLTSDIPKSETPALLESLEDASAELRTQFGVDFLLWKQSFEETVWEPVVGNDSQEQIDLPAAVQAEYFSMLAKSAAEHECMVHSMGQHSLIIIPMINLIPHRLKSVPLVAAGLVPQPDIATLRRHAKLVLRLLEEKKHVQKLETLNERYAEQVSHDFEELHWLRDLSQQIGYCSVDKNMTDVAEKVLPTLCDIIKTEALIFVPEYSAERPDDNRHFIAGNADIDVKQCWETIHKFRDEAIQQPVVNNDNFVNQNISTDGIPYSFALVPVSKNSFHAGWLLAFNRIHERDPEYQREKHSISETSLGTFEVGLMIATGNLLANHARNLHLFRERKELTIGVVRSLINTVDAKDSYTCGHSERVALMAKRVAMQMRLSEEKCERIYMTGLLHDIGKIGIPDEVLGKKGKLTDEEFEIIKKHPEIGHAIMRHLKPLEYALPGILHHHESYDGTGYPDKLAAEDIPLDGRILAVVDAYDAMTSSRPYRTAMPPKKAESILLENAGIQWDPQIVKCFFAALKDIHKICERTEKEAKGLFDVDVLANSETNSDSISSAVIMTHNE